MAAANFTPEQMQKIKEITSMPYAEQAIFYLNAFWSYKENPAEAQAEDCWKLVEAFSKEDHVKGKDGNELNPIQAFHVLQARNQTLTALELKAQLRKVDIDANGEMALFEYLLFTYNRDPIVAITLPQGDIDPAQLKALEDKLAELDLQFQQLQEKEKAAKESERIAKEAQAKADAAAAVAKKAEDEVRAVEDEARAIDAEIKAQEKAKLDEMARLEALTQDQTVGIVKRNMAVQQLATLKNEDSLPLQKAKLTQEAVVRRLAKVTEAAAKETAIANEAAAVAKSAADDAAQAVKEVQEKLAQIECSMKEVESELEALRNSPASPMGKLFWASRQLEDKKRSLPQRMW